MRSIELVFDGFTDSTIRADWSRLAAAGVPSLAGHTAPSNSPHITLAAGPGLRLPADLDGLWQLLPLDVEFSGAQLFPAGPGKFVLARSVVVTGPLLQLHTRLHSGIPEALPLTRPGAWTPHVTLARRVPAGLLGPAMDVLDLRLQGQCSGARLWDSATRTITPLR
ncbi:2'-5' RNA ligase family protein [Pseudarthrobacter sp. NamE2]|uniref:2'-5' RNA ligase family protein n=1 Tax=Pseudarthrobacter sp. NamE2 TaxID=2576838 RepID=UPI0010FEEE55|nr:2'-5' RNA ligase family protein [Pseudarthrobacter sp. NamE2]TLM83012.1 2'-5' RNA ligase family protein [Pseudarthrobacter sp. NamE2]